MCMTRSVWQCVAGDPNQLLVWHAPQKKNRQVEKLKSHHNVNFNTSIAPCTFNGELWPEGAKTKTPLSYVSDVNNKLISR